MSVSVEAAFTLAAALTEAAALCILSGKIGGLFAGCFAVQYSMPKIAKLQPRHYQKILQL